MNVFEFSKKTNFTLKEVTPKKETWICEVCLRFNNNKVLFKPNVCTCGADRRD
jgi:hypothetical protein